MEHPSFTNVDFVTIHTFNPQPGYSTHRFSLTKYEIYLKTIWLSKISQQEFNYKPF